jgi:two-component system cell cycle sensor histidine kinase/response regulator CckA
VQSSQLKEIVTLLDQFDLPFYVVDDRLSVVMANHSACSILECEPTHFPISPLHFLSAIEFTRFRQAAELVRSQGKWEGEFEFSRDGKVVGEFGCRWVHLEGTPYLGILIRQRSEVKQLQNQVLRLQRMESIGSISSGLAHDLNNILSTFLMAAKLLRPKVEDAQGQEVLGMIEKGVKRGISLVAQMLSFIRGEQAQNETVNLNTIVYEIKEMMSKMWAENLQFEVECPQTVVEFTGNAVQIHQVVLNLCVNARDVLQEEGGVIRVSVENIDLTEFDIENLQALSPGPHVCVRVVDSGKGIDPKIQAQIFEPFFTTKAPGKGSGLGLSTVQFIVKSHKGHIVVNSIPNQGTEIVVYFPTA